MQYEPICKLEIDKETFLKTFSLHDCVALFELVEKNRSEFKRWLPWVDNYKTTQDAQEFIHKALVQNDSYDGFHCGIWHQGKLAGCLGIHHINWVNKATSLGYYLDEAYSGKGIMTKACSALITHLFDKFKLHRIEIRCATDNERSIAIAERLGFSKEGQLEEVEWLYDHFVDHFIYAMTTKKWKIARRKAA